MYNRNGRPAPIFILLLCVLTLLGCEKEKEAEYSLEILKIKPMDSIPSGSGLLFHQGRLVILGDDSPNLFFLDLEDSSVSKLSLTSNFGEVRRIPKDIKPDLESLALSADSSIIAFPSGTLAPQRDTLHILQNDKIYKYDLHPFYQSIADKYDIGLLGMNIEGAEIIGDRLYLLDRGTNALLELSFSDLMAHLQDQKDVPDVQRTVFDLPQIDSVSSGFSGLSRLGLHEKLLFTASVEDTPNWFEDGERLGSFIGLIDLTETPKLVDIWQVMTSSKIQSTDKIEGLTFKGYDERGRILITAVTDNDDGSSKIIELALSVKLVEK